MSISTLKWPVLAMMVPSCMASKCSPRSTWMSPVAVTKSLAILAASATGMTRKPSMTASSARSGSTSSTMTSAPWPFMRMARPRPHQP